MCYPCDRGIVLPICPGYTLSDPGMNPGAMIVRPSAAGSHKFVAHPCDPCDQPRPLSMLASTNMGGAGERVSLASPSTSGERLPWARRHTAILDAAIELFSERGFQGTTTRSLAAAAGVTEPVLYRHFPTKQDLYSAIIEYKAEAAGAPLEEALSAEFRAGDDRTFFLGLGRYIRARYESDPALVRLLLFSALEGHGLAQTFFERRVLVQYRFVGDYISRRVAEGAFRDDVEPVIAARSFLGSVHHRCLMTMTFAFNDGQSCEPDAFEAFVSIFLRGMQSA